VANFTALSEFFTELTKKETLAMIAISMIRHTELLDVGMFLVQRVA
jgi:hypothetical protein